MKINASKLVVEEALLRNPDFRDDDRRLMVYLWRKEMLNAKTGLGLDVYNLEERNAIEKFFRRFSLGKHHHGPTIKRIRAKLQEEFPNLRGKKYYERKEVQTKQVQADLGYAPQIGGPNECN